MAENINTKQYLIVLLLMVILSSIGYSLVRQLEPTIASTIYVGLLYMPTPFYALVAVSKLNKQPLNLPQYGRMKNINIRGILGTISLFISWLVLFGAMSWLLSLSLPNLTGQFATDDRMILDNIQTLVGAEAASTANLPSDTFQIIAVGFVGAILSGFTVNLLFALGEEYGWRGYLYKRIKRGFLTKNAIIGGLWGLWHAPLILQGYNFGDDYRLQGAIWFIVFTLCLGYVFGVLMEKYKNVLYAGAFHGMFNGFVGIFPILLGSYNPLIGGPIGAVSAISFLIVAVVAYLYMLRPNKTKLTAS